jgi:hypothetical protein
MGTKGTDLEQEEYEMLCCFGEENGTTTYCVKLD